MKNLIRNNRLLRPIAKAVYFTLIAPFKSFAGSEDYWKQRYQSGGTSGAGSYDKLAEFKAEVLNRLVKERQVTTVIEYGCGDGNQLKLAEYPSYIGFDVSPVAIEKCEAIFSNDDTKTFRLMDEYTDEKAELTLSLDVIYHLIEDSVFVDYMERLFDSSTKLVVIYSSDTDTQERFQAAHLKHRKFSNWVARNRPGWVLIQHIPNRYPYRGDDKTGSFADFFVYERK